MAFTPRKINMEPEIDGLVQMIFRISIGWFLGSMLIFRECTLSYHAHRLIANLHVYPLTAHQRWDEMRSSSFIYIYKWIYIQYVFESWGENKYDSFSRYIDMIDMIIPFWKGNLKRTESLEFQAKNNSSSEKHKWATGSIIPQNRV